MKKSKFVKEPRKAIIKEHIHLVKVLRSGYKKDDKVEAKKQVKELKGYKKGKN